MKWLVERCDVRVMTRLVAAGAIAASIAYCGTAQAVLCSADGELVVARC